MIANRDGFNHGYNHGGITPLPYVILTDAVSNTNTNHNDNNVETDEKFGIENASQFTATQESKTKHLCKWPPKASIKRLNFHNSKKSYSDRRKETFKTAKMIIIRSIMNMSGVDWPSFSFINEFHEHVNIMCDLLQHTKWFGPSTHDDIKNTPTYPQRKQDCMNMFASIGQMLHLSYDFGLKEIKQLENLLTQSPFKVMNQVLWSKWHNCIKRWKSEMKKKCIASIKLTLLDPSIDSIDKLSEINEDIVFAKVWQLSKELNVEWMECEYLQCLLCLVVNWNQFEDDSDISAMINELSKRNVGCQSIPWLRNYFQTELVKLSFVKLIDLIKNVFNKSNYFGQMCMNALGTKSKKESLEAKLVVQLFEAIENTTHDWPMDTISGCVYQIFENAINWDNNDIDQSWHPVFQLINKWNRIIMDDTPTPRLLPILNDIYNLTKHSTFVLKIIYSTFLVKDICKRVGQLTTMSKSIPSELLMFAPYDSFNTPRRKHFRFLKLIYNTDKLSLEELEALLVEFGGDGYQKNYIELRMSKLRHNLHYFHAFYNKKDLLWIDNRYFKKYDIHESPNLCLNFDQILQCLSDHHARVYFAQCNKIPYPFFQTIDNANLIYRFSTKGKFLDFGKGLAMMQNGDERISQCDINQKVEEHCNPVLINFKVGDALFRRGHKSIHSMMTDLSHPNDKSVIEIGDKFENVWYYDDKSSMYKVDKALFGQRGTIAGVSVQYDKLYSKESQFPKVRFRLNGNHKYQWIGTQNSIGELRFDAIIWKNSHNKDIRTKKLFAAIFTPNSPLSIMAAQTKDAPLKIKRGSSGIKAHLHGNDSYARTVSHMTGLDIDRVPKAKEKGYIGKLQLSLFGIIYQHKRASNFSIGDGEVGFVLPNVSEDLLKEFEFMITDKFDSKMVYKINMHCEIFYNHVQDPRMIVYRRPANSE